MMALLPLLHGVDVTPEPLHVLPQHEPAEDAILPAVSVHPPLEQPLRESLNASQFVHRPAPYVFPTALRSHRSTTHCQFFSPSLYASMSERSRSKPKM